MGPATGNRAQAYSMVRSRREKPTVSGLSFVMLRIEDPSEKTGTRMLTGFGVATILPTTVVAEAVLFAGAGSVSAPETTPVVV